MIPAVVIFFVTVLQPDQPPIQHHWEMPSLEACTVEVNRTIADIAPMLPNGAAIQAGCHFVPAPAVDARS
jgi:hypothetical protein